MEVSKELSFNLRTASSGVREQWFQVLTPYCEFPGQERVVSTVGKMGPQGDGTHKFEEVYVNFTDYGLSEPIVSDCENLRLAIPGDQVHEVNMTMLYKLVKEMIGQDLSKFSMPVFLNEPTTILMKPAEFMFFNDFFSQASKEPDPTKRMLLVAIKSIAQFFCVFKRSGKPFNPLLGETYELVTPQFRYFAEMVSHHPPISAYCCDGEGYQIRRTCETVQAFNGKTVSVHD